MGLCSGHGNSVVIRELSLYPQSLLAKLTVHPKIFSNSNAMYMGKLVELATFCTARTRTHQKLKRKEKKVKNQLEHALRLKRGSRI